MGGSRNTAAVISSVMLTLLLPLHPAFAATPDTTATATAVRVERAMRIDGRLDEAAWREAPLLTGFRRHNVDPGTTASYPTNVWVLYDDHNLYVGMRLHDPEPGQIAGQLGRRDSNTLYSDWASVLIDSHLDRRTAYLFSLSPRQVKRDGRMYDDTEGDMSWDGVWEGAARIDDEGWIAEFRIPFSQIRFTIDPNGSTLWGVNFGREIARLDEESYWEHIPPDAGRFVSRFGLLRGIRDIPNPRRVELIPYALGSSSRLAGAAEDPFRGDFIWGTEGGLDLRYGLGQGLSFTGTINPDFGHVEIDPAVINLTAFETFYPERRPFFVEDSEIFQRGIGALFNPSETLFYSRRIGRAPQGSVPVDATYADVPNATRILTAAKLSGRTPGGWTIGVLHALTDSEEADYVTADDESQSVRVEPRTQYAVTRLRRNFHGGGSALGALATATRRSIRDDHLRMLPEAAYTGAIDWRHRFGADQYELSGWVAASHVRGDASAVDHLQRAPARLFHRPDGDHLTYDPDRTSLSGAAAEVGIRKIAGVWRSGAIGTIRSPGFDTNDLGFLQSADQIRTSTWLGYVRVDGGRFFRNWSVFTNQHGGWTTGGERLPATVDLNSLYQLRNQWQGFVGIRHISAGLAPEVLRGGPALRKSSRTGGWFQIATDPRRRVNTFFTVTGDVEHDTPGSTFSVAVGPTFRPSPSWNVSLRAAWSRTLNSQQYVATRIAEGERHYVLGRIDQSVLALVTRLDVTFSSDLTLELFAQPFVSSVRYLDFKRVGDAHAASTEQRWINYTDEQLRAVSESEERVTWGYFAETADEDPTYTFADPGFNLRSLRGNAVLRWEYRPGSTIFLVWQQNRRDVGFGKPLDPVADLRSLGSAAGDHVLLVKVSYWLGR